jgi:ribosomal protein L16 Arg81 hydroxylase
VRDLGLEHLVIEAAGVIDQIEMAVRRCGSLKSPQYDRSPILIGRVRQMRAKIETAVRQNAALEQAFRERICQPADQHEPFCDADFTRAVEILQERKNWDPA